MTLAELRALERSLELLLCQVTAVSTRPSNTR